MGAKEGSEDGEAETVGCNVANRAGGIVMMVPFPVWVELAVASLEGDIVDVLKVYSAMGALVGETVAGGTVAP